MYVLVYSGTYYCAQSMYELHEFEHEECDEKMYENFSSSSSSSSGLIFGLRMTLIAFVIGFSG